MKTSEEIRKLLEDATITIELTDPFADRTYRLNVREEVLDAFSTLESRLAQVERERDAAIVDMRSMAVEDICNLCARLDEGYIPMPPHCKYANDGDCFRWRGVCAENTKEEEK